MNRVKELKHHPTWKRQVLIFVLDLLLMWQVIEELHIDFARWFLDRSLPVRIGLINFAVLAMTLVLIPLPPQLPAIAIPILWGGAYCVTLSIALLLPARRKNIFIHWVNL